MTIPEAYLTLPLGKNKEMTAGGIFFGTVGYLMKGLPGAFIGTALSVIYVRNRWKTAEDNATQTFNNLVIQKVNHQWDNFKNALITTGIFACLALTAAYNSSSFYQIVPITTTAATITCGIIMIRNYVKANLFQNISDNHFGVK